MDAGAGADVGALIGDLAVAAGAVGRPAVDTAADVVGEEELAAVDTASAVVDARAGLSPRWASRDLLFPGADDDVEGVDGGLMGDVAVVLPFEGGGVVDVV